REGDGHVLAQAAHAADVLFAGAAVDDRARTEEEQRLEEGMGDEVEDADGWAADAEAHHHVSKLRNGGVGEDALDVELRDRDGGGEERGARADPGNNFKGNEGRRLNRALNYRNRYAYRTVCAQWNRMREWSVRQSDNREDPSHQKHTRSNHG